MHIIAPTTHNSIKALTLSAVHEFVQSSAHQITIKINFSQLILSSIYRTLSRKWVEEIGQLRVARR